MSDVEFKTNIPDFLAQMTRFSYDLTKNTIRLATTAAARVFRNEAQRIAPVLQHADNRRVPGLLKKEIYIYRSRSGSTQGTEFYKISFRKGKKAAERNKDAFYGAFLEYGWIPRGPGKALRGGRASKRLARARGAAGRITKYAFIAPAFKNVGTEAIRVFSARMQQRIDQENKKL